MSILDPEGEECPGNPIQSQPLLIGIELKYSDGSKPEGISECLSDQEKMEEYRNRSGGPEFGFLVLCFLVDSVAWRGTWSDRRCTKDSQGDRLIAIEQVDRYDTIYFADGSSQGGKIYRFEHETEKNGVISQLFPIRKRFADRAQCNLQCAHDQFGMLK